MLQQTINGRAPILLPQHLKDLRRAGLNDWTIKACGFHSLTADRDVHLALNWKFGYDGQLGPCLAIPFCDAEGRPTGYCRLKPDKPHVGKHGRPVEYESPKGSSRLPYFPPKTLAALKDRSCPLLITEGELKAAKAAQEGFPCIGLVGVYGWQKKQPRDETGNPVGEKELIDGLASVAWEERTVYLCFDSAVHDNLNALRALAELAKVLTKRKARVWMARLPEGKVDHLGVPAKVGLDDFLVQHGPDALRRLLDEAGPPPDPDYLLPNEAPVDPHRLARMFLDRHYRVAPRGLPH
jgi:hypothetical protein